MVKMICVMFIVAASSEVLGSVTNLDQIVNVPLTASVLSNVPQRLFVTPHTAYLNFVRSLALSDAKSMVAGFMPEKIMQITGTTNPDSLGDHQESQMRELVCGSGCTNFMLTAYCMSNSTGRVRVTATIRAGRDASATEDQYPITFLNTNGVWLIDGFLADEE